MSRKRKKNVKGTRRSGRKGRARTRTSQPLRNWTPRVNVRQAGPLSPAGFLRDLGIERSSPQEVFTEDYYRDVARARGNPFAREKYGYMSPEAGDMNSVTEDIARRFHSAEYARLLGLLRSFTRIHGYPAAPRRVADLGGGTGIVSLYLATHHPDSHVVVYDHSPGQLRLGRKWAADRKLRNVEYVQASYQQLAAGPDRADNDLVLFFWGMDVDVPGPGPTAGEQAALNALARLLGPHGVGVISGLLPTERKSVQFEAIRRAGLGVDWRFTRCLGVVDGPVCEVWENYIFVRRDMPHLGEDSRADALAHLKSVEFNRGPRGFRLQLPESYATRFRDADVLLVAEIGSRGEVLESRLLQKGGHLLLEGHADDGMKGYALDTLAGVAGLLEMVHPGWQRGDPLDFRRYEVHPRLERFMSFCRQHGTLA